MTYLGKPVSQLDGSYYAHHNCVVASATALEDASSLGYWRTSPARLRTLSGDTYGGMIYPDGVTAVSKASGGEVKLSFLYGAPQNSTTSTLDNLLDAPRVVATIISCAVTRYTPYATGTYTGLHSIVVGAKRYATVTKSDGSTYQQKQALVMDPGRTLAKWVWWPWSLLIKATAAAAGSGSIHVMYTRDLGNVSRVAKANGAVRSSTEVKATNIVGAIISGQSYTVLETVKGSDYPLSGRTLNGWNRIGTNKYVVAKIR